MREIYHSVLVPCPYVFHVLQLLELLLCFHLLAMDGYLCGCLVKGYNDCGLSFLGFLLLCEGGVWRSS